MNPALGGNSEISNPRVLGSACVLQLLLHAKSRNKARLRPMTSGAGDLPLRLNPVAQQACHQAESQWRSVPCEAASRYGKRSEGYLLERDSIVYGCGVDQEPTSLGKASNTRWVKYRTDSALVCVVTIRECCVWILCHISFGSSTIPSETLHLLSITTFLTDTSLSSTMAFLQPRDPRWQGPQRWYLAIDLVKNILLFFFVILVIVETTLYRKWYNTYYSTVEFDSDETAYVSILHSGTHKKYPS